MKTAVLIKGVPDTESVLEVAPDGKSVSTEGLTFIMNPYDEYALEEAILVRERSGGEVMAVSMGGDEADKVLRMALALGVDSAAAVRPPGGSEPSGLGVSKMLAAALARWAPDLVLAGRQAVDSEGSQVPERVAELLDMPHLSSVTNLDVADHRLLADCETEGGGVRVQVGLPALVTVQKGINEPRYPTLPAIIKARKLPIAVLSATDLGLSEEQLSPGIKVLGVVLFRKERKGVIIPGDIEQGTIELVNILRHRERIL